MFLLVCGVVVLVITGAIFLALLPRGGRTHRWVNTEWEPYISVAICSGVTSSAITTNFGGATPASLTAATVVSGPIPMSTSGWASATASASS